MSVWIMSLAETTGVRHLIVRLGIVLLGAVALVRCRRVVIRVRHRRVWPSDLGAVSSQWLADRRGT